MLWSFDSHPRWPFGGTVHMLISAFVATCVGFFYRARKARRLEREQAARTEARNGTNL